jgi:hypothetical protein
MSPFSGVFVRTRPGTYVRQGRPAVVGGVTYTATIGPFNGAYRMQAKLAHAGYNTRVTLDLVYRSVNGTWGWYDASTSKLYNSKTTFMYT